MTISTLEYALMAGNAYFDTRDKINRIAYPGYLGWDPIPGELNHRAIISSGFEARAFIRTDGQIVISYAGTYFPQTADLVADIAIGTGFAHNQLLQAALY